MRELYLDANAHLGMSEASVKAFVKFNGSVGGHGNAMSPSVPGRAAMLAIEGVREKIGEIFGVSGSSLIFTGNCTSACEWGVKIFSKVCGSVGMSTAEHPAIKSAVGKYFGEVREFGICDGVVVGSGDAICVRVQNEVGVIQPGEFGGRLLSDFSQVVGKMRVDLSGVDVGIFAAHKFGGPVGVGVLYLRDYDWWEEFGTGSRYYFDRAGTPDAASIVAAGAALEDVELRFSEISGRMLEFRDRVESGFNDMGIGVIGAGVERVVNTTFVQLKSGWGMKMLSLLGEEGIYIGLGSACGSSYTGLNPYLKSMGIVGNPHDFIRISTFGEYGSEDASYFLEKFRKYYLKGGD